MKKIAVVSGQEGINGVSRHYVAHRHGLIELAMNIVGCRLCAEEIVQDAYLKIVDMHDAVYTSSYLYRVVRNLAIVRKGRIQQEIRVAVESACVGMAAVESITPEYIAIQRQTMGVLIDTLATLPLRTQTAFLLYRVAGLPQREIAVQLHISTTLVNFMIRDATLLCKKNLHKNNTC